MLKGQFRRGIAAMLPLALSAMPFGMIYGSEAMRKGLSLAETLLMSLIVFAGGSQFLAVSLWHYPVPWLGIAAAVLLVNLRHTLMAASLVSKLGSFKPWQIWLGAYIMADETWATSERQALNEKLTPAFYFGVALTLYVLWAMATLIGAVLGSLIPNPERFGFDFAFPAMFICLVLGFAKDWRAAPVIAASALAALAAKYLVDGTWFVIAGGVSGMLAAALLPPAEEEALK